MHAAGVRAKWVIVNLIYNKSSILVFTPTKVGTYTYVLTPGTFPLSPAGPGLRDRPLAGPAAPERFLQDPALPLLGAAGAAGHGATAPGAKVGPQAVHGACADGHAVQDWLVTLNDIYNQVKSCLGCYTHTKSATSL